MINIYLFDNSIEKDTIRSILSFFIMFISIFIYYYLLKIKLNYKNLLLFSLIFGILIGITHFNKCSIIKDNCDKDVNNLLIQEYNMFIFGFIMSLFIILLQPKIFDLNFYSSCFIIIIVVLNILLTNKIVD